MLVILYDTLAQQNTIQIIGLCMYSVALTIYGILQVSAFQEANHALVVQEAENPGIEVVLRTFIILIAFLGGFSSFMLCFVAWKIYTEFSWVIFRNLDASIRMQRLYLAYQVASSDSLLFSS